MTTHHEGGCQCGKVRYTTRGEPVFVIVCHCTWCQRRTGSAFAVMASFGKDQVQLIGEPTTKYRSHSDESGRWLDLEFDCACGTNIGFTLEWAPTVYAISSGTFDRSNWISTSKQKFHHIFRRSAQDWTEVTDHVHLHERHFLE